MTGNDALKKFDFGEEESKALPQQNCYSQNRFTEKIPPSNRIEASDVSSVSLDSNDSCYQSSIEVIKLAPAKKKSLESPKVGPYYSKGKV